MSFKSNALKMVPVLAALSLPVPAFANTLSFTGLAFDGAGNQATPATVGRWSVLHDGIEQNSMNGAIIAEFPNALDLSLPLNYSLSGWTSFDNTGGLDGASLAFGQSDLVFENNITLRILADDPGNSVSSELTIIDDDQYNFDIQLPSGFGTSNPRYGLTGNISFELRTTDTDDFLFGSVFELIGTDTNNPLDVGPFNSLGVGDFSPSNGTPNETVFFVWAGSRDAIVADQNSPLAQHDGKYVGIDLGGWGQTMTPVPVPGAIWLFGSAILGFAGLRARNLKG